MPRSVEALSREILTDPARVEIERKTVAPSAIKQRVIHVRTPEKRELLKHLLKEDAMKRVIVFTRTKHMANRVAEQLEKSGQAAEALHGNKSQSARQNALKRFQSGQARVLVATDIAARGIDVPSISHVINYDLPNEPESYVHRIGRTARAGGSGVAISFCDRGEIAYLKDIEKLIGITIEAEGDLPSPEEMKRQAPAAPQKKRGGRPGRGKPQARKQGGGWGKPRRGGQQQRRAA